VRRWFAAAALATAACEGDTTPDWQLAHDRIIAIRATPPGVPAGGRATIDALVTTVDAGPHETAPVAIAAAPGTPAALAGAVAGGEVIAPEAAVLAAVRVELGLPADAPVPLAVAVAVAVGDATLPAAKTVWLGAAAENPVIGELRIAGVAAGDAMTAAAGEIELAIDAGPDDAVHWLTSIGELDDAEDPIAHLDAGEPGTGVVAVVRRDAGGGVAWGYVALTVR
jgi:hypothetical protein